MKQKLKRKKDKTLYGYKLTDKYILDLLVYFKGNINSVKEYLQECDSRAGRGKE